MPDDSHGELLELLVLRRSVSTDLLFESIDLVLKKFGRRDADISTKLPVLPTFPSKHRQARFSIASQGHIAEFAKFFNHNFPGLLIHSGI